MCCVGGLGRAQSLVLVLLGVDVLGLGVWGLYLMGVDVLGLGVWELYLMGVDVLGLLMCRIGDCRPNP